MDFSGTETVEVAIGEVWKYLVDVRKVAACGPGFQDLEEIEPEHWKAHVSIGIGPIKAKLMLDVTRPEIHEPDLMVIKVHGKASGSAIEVVTRMSLIALEAKQTCMDWHANVVVGGMLASIGTRLMNSAAEKLTEQFFTCLKDHLQSQTASETSSSTQAEN
ncbi:MAG TPA: carbon monoxide dehydrogenase subunit G [Ktedonobacteraceae bacterium]|jgi:carbon monoxide dehydrogenase subunit G